MIRERTDGDSVVDEVDVVEIDELAPLRSEFPTRALALKARVVFAWSVHCNPLRTWSRKSASCAIGKYGTADRDR